MTVTNHMVRKLLAEVNFESRNGVRGISSNTATASRGDVPSGITVSEKTIERVLGDVLIAKDGTKAKLFSPLPCMHWTCLGVANDEGLIFLQQPFNALIISDGENSWCLGVDGRSSEFQLSVEVGDNIVSINNLYVNVQTDHEIKNGVER